MKMITMFFSNKYDTDNVISYVMIPNKVQGKVLKDKLKLYGIKG